MRLNGAINFEVPPEQRESPHTEHTGHIVKVGSVIMHVKHFGPWTIQIIKSDLMAESSQLMPLINTGNSRGRTNDKPSPTI